MNLENKTTIYFFNLKNEFNKRFYLSVNFIIIAHKSFKNIFDIYSYNVDIITDFKYYSQTIMALS